MSKALTISVTELLALAAAERGNGTTLIAPTRFGDTATEYRIVDDVDEIVLSGPLPRSPLKRFFLPPTEPLFAWRRQGNSVVLDEMPTAVGLRLVLGARPCDAAALLILDRVMGWDCDDEPWFARRQATTIIGMACDDVDRCCLCTTVGCAPDSGTGCDLLLHPDEEGFAVEVITSRGRELVETHKERFQEAEPGQMATPRAPTPTALSGVDLARMRSWLEANFEHLLWQELALVCHGCGVCAAMCPTCHCFDIVDEPNGVTSGTRRRNWDTCQSALFTVHASGHNPRPDQSTRLRQRLLHKFAFYPRRFDEILCTGCGRCTRACPAGIDLREILQRIAEQASGGSP